MRRKQAIMVAAISAVTLGMAGCSSNSSNQAQTTAAQTSAAISETEETLGQTNVVTLETEETAVSDDDAAEEHDTVIATTDTYTRTERHLDNKGSDIYGELYLPQNRDEKIPLVILTHGLGGTSAGGERYATEFAEIGIATYCYDLRFASENSRSDPNTTQLTPFTAKSDLQTAIDASKTWDFVDEDNVFLMGYSLGGLTTGITASDNMDYIQAEIMFYPAFNVQEEVERLAAMGDAMPDTFDLTGVTLGRALVDETLGYDLYAQAQKFNKNVLLIHGDADPVVPISSSERLKDGMASVEYHVIKDGVHSFQGEHFEEAIRYVKDFLNKEINRE